MLHCIVSQPQARGTALESLEDDLEPVVSRPSAAAEDATKRKGTESRILDSLTEKNVAARGSPIGSRRRIGAAAAKAEAAVAKPSGKASSLMRMAAAMGNAVGRLAGGGPAVEPEDDVTELGVQPMEDTVRIRV